MIRPLTAAAAVLLLHSGLAEGREEALTLEKALALARARGPAYRASVARIEEARARLAGAGILLPGNPSLELAAGPRSTPRSDALDVEVGLSQGFHPAGSRSARVDSARAALDRETHASADAERRLQRDVGVAFYQALHARELSRLAAAAQTVASEIAQSVQRRYELGDVAALDLNVARGGLSRARAEALSSSASERESLGRLRILLGMDVTEPLSIDGDLGTPSRLDRIELRAAAAHRPDLAILEDDRREAEADLRLGEALARPELGVGVRYEREEEDHVVLGGLTLTLPFVRRGQEIRAEARARAARVTLEIEAGRRALMSELEALHEVAERRHEAAVELERGALPLLEENESLARRGWEAGEMSLVEYLVIRRDAIETRREHLNRLLESDVAVIELEAVAGVRR